MKIKRSFHLLVGLILLLAALPVLPAQAAGVRYAKPATSGTGSCLSWANACILQTALAGALSGDEIWVAAGTYRPTTGTDRSVAFQLMTGIALYGGFAGTETARTQRSPAVNLTILSGDIDSNDSANPVTDVSQIVGNNSYNVVTGYGVASSAILDGFIITAGSADAESDNVGGGLYSNGIPTLTNVTFSGNKADFGGGMYNDSSSPALTNVTFSGNTAKYSGGGIYNEAGNPTLVNVTFSDNSAQYAGGMENDSSSPTLTGGTFNGNTASKNGGGMINGGSSGSNPTLTNVTFSGNTANTLSGWGGGMYNYTNSNPTLASVTFSSNSAEHGGGMANEAASPTMTDVIFSGNSAGYGGGMENDNSSNPMLTGGAFFGNSAPYGGGMYNSSSNPTLTYITFSGNSGGQGGGMYDDTSSPILMNVTFSGNTALEAGGMLDDYGDPILTNVTFSGNSATGGSGSGMGGGMKSSVGNPELTNVTFNNNSAKNGGGMFIMLDDSAALTNVTFSGNSASWGGGMEVEYTTNVTLTNVTFSGNSASDTGGGLDFSQNEELEIRNTIFWGNTAINGGAQIYIYSDYPTYIPNISDSVVQGGCPSESTCTNIITTDPLLGTLDNYGGFTQTIPLQVGSSAIDTGNDDTCASLDQRGIVRPQGTHCDIGAFEYAIQTFADVPYNYSVTYGEVIYYLHDIIQALYDAGYTKGCSTDPLAYCPNNTLTRVEAAVFMLRGLEGTAYSPPTDPADFVFTDDWSSPTVNWGQPWAEGMWDEGLTAGCQTSPLLFCPTTAFTRAEASVFGLRIENGASYTPPAATHIFADDWSSSTISWAEAWAEQAYLHGLLPACGESGGKPLFCPGDLVTRAWAAYLVVEAKDLPLTP